jgi:hypothetical protein
VKRAGARFLERGEAGDSRGQTADIQACAGLRAEVHYYFEFIS